MKLTMSTQTPNGTLSVVLTGDLDGDSIVNGKAEIEGLGQMDRTAKRIGRSAARRDAGRGVQRRRPRQHRPGSLALLGR